MLFQILYAPEPAGPGAEDLVVVLDVRFEMGVRVSPRGPLSSRERICNTSRPD